MKSARDEGIKSVMYLMDWGEEGLRSVGGGVLGRGVEGFEGEVGEGD